MEAITSYDRVLSELRSAILAGTHPPGSRLRQVELASAYRTSRIPLREALRTLQAEGLVLSEANRGATVAPLDAADLAELYIFREALERVSARTAAARRFDLRGQVDEWSRIAREAVRSGRLEPLIEVDAAFHRAIAEAAGNRHVLFALNRRWAHIARAMRLFLSADTFRVAVWDEHQAVAEAMAAGDEDAAEALLGAHVHRSGHFVLSRLPPTRAPG